MAATCASRASPSAGSARSPSGASSSPKRQLRPKPPSDGTSVALKDVRVGPVTERSHPRSKIPRNPWRGPVPAPLPDDEMLRRIKAELIDGCDEEVELEIEDRAGDPAPASDAERT